eukprot:scaffold22774_cov55-Attheya_sp.AAC.3
MPRRRMLTPSQFEDGDCEFTTSRHRPHQPLGGPLELTSRIEPSPDQAILGRSVNFSPSITIIKNSNHYQNTHVHISQLDASKAHHRWKSRRTIKMWHGILLIIPQLLCLLVGCQAIQEIASEGRESDNPKWDRVGNTVDYKWIQRLEEKRRLHHGKRLPQSQWERDGRKRGRQLSVKTAECIDDNEYRDQLGLSCADHLESNADCSAFGDIGYTDAAMVELYTMCPNGCRVAPCNTSNRHDRKLHRQKDERNDFVSQSQPERNEFTLASNLNRNLQEPKQCFEDQCEDKLDYTSPIISAKCYQHAFLDCASFMRIGFSEQDVFNLVEACPCSCNVMCG